MEQVQLHRHPTNTNSTVTGQRLQVGDVLDYGDLYDSGYGRWKPIQKYLVGTAISEVQNRILTFVRPVEPAA